MKILLLSQFGHTQLLDALVSNLHRNSINADCFNIVNWQIPSKSELELPMILKLLKPFIKIPKVRGILLKLFRKSIVINLAKNYQIIDIHFFDPFYDKVIPKLKAHGMKIKITVLGSDFYPIKAERIEQQRPLYGMVDCIQVATHRMGSDFLKKFPEHSSKIRYGHFGMQQFSFIEQFDLPHVLNSYQNALGIPKEKIIVACGYNGNRRQQHGIIIDSISKLPKHQKDSLFLVLHMTYGSTPSYIEEIKKQLDKSGLQYKLFVKYQSPEDLAKLRLITKIAVNIQISDAFSASIQEYIFAGNILIAGDWLPYDFLKENNIYYIETDRENLGKMISNCLGALDFYKDKCIHNRERVSKFSSWESSIKDWVSIYNELAG